MSASTSFAKGRRKKIEDKNIDEEKKEDLMLARAEEKAAAALVSKLNRLTEKCKSLRMPPVTPEDPGDMSLHPADVLSVKTRLLNAEAEHYSSIMPELYKKGAEVELAVVKNNISEAKDMAKLIEIQKDMRSRLEAKNESTKIAAKDLLEVYRGLLGSVKSAPPEEQAKATIPILNDLLRTLKDKMKNILSKVVPNEKEKIMEILSILDSAKNNDGGWCSIQSLTSRSQEEDTSDEEDRDDTAEPEVADDAMEIEPDDRRKKREKKKKDDPTEAYFGAVTILMNCHIIEVHPEDPSLFRLFAAQP